MWKTKILLCLMLMSLANCTTSTADKWCDNDDIITVTKADVITPVTAREILIHNDVGTKICGW